MVSELPSIEAPKNHRFEEVWLGNKNSFVKDKHMFIVFFFLYMTECCSEPILNVYFCTAKLHQWCGTPWSKLSGQHRDGLCPAGECVLKEDQIQENPLWARWEVKENTDFMWKSNPENKLGFHSEDALIFYHLGPWRSLSNWVIEWLRFDLRKLKSASHTDQGISFCIWQQPMYSKALSNCTAK